MCRAHSSSVPPSDKIASECPKAVPRIEAGRAELVVIDADRHNPKEDGVQAFAALGDEHQEFPHPQTLTAGGGEHHYYREPAGQAFGNSEGNLPEGINVRGRGGLVVAPGAGRPDWYVGDGPRDARIDGGFPGDRNKRNRSSDAAGLPD